MFHSDADIPPPITPDLGSRAVTIAIACELCRPTPIWSTAPGSAQTFLILPPQGAWTRVACALSARNADQPAPVQYTSWPAANANGCAVPNSGSSLSRFGSFAIVRGGSGPSRSASAKIELQPPA